VSGPIRPGKRRLALETWLLPLPFGLIESRGRVVV